MPAYYSDLFYEIGAGPSTQRGINCVVAYQQRLNIDSHKLVWLHASVMLNIFHFHFHVPVVRSGTNTCRAFAVNTNFTPANSYYFQTSLMLDLVIYLFKEN